MAWRSVTACAAALTVLAAAVTGADAQGSGSATLKIIAPLRAGSTFDIQARVIGNALHEMTGRTVIVEDRPGANMSLAALACKNAPADGNTICLFTHNLFLNPLLRSDLNYDPNKDLQPVAALSLLEQVFVVSKRLPVKTFAELVKYSKDHPNTLNYGSVGVGSAAHLVQAWLQKVSGGDWKHIPYNGSPKVQAALAAGDIHMTFTPSGNVMGRIKAGDLKPLLTVGDKRNPKLPNVPTIAEAGLPPLPAKSWSGMFAPAGAPAATVAKLHDEIIAIVNTPAFEKRSQQMGLSPAPMTLAEFKAFIAKDQAAWKPLVEASGVKRK